MTERRDTVKLCRMVRRNGSQQVEEIMSTALRIGGAKCTAQKILEAYKRNLGAIESGSDESLVVSLDMDQEEKFLAIMKQSEVPYLLLGHVTKGKLDIDGESFGFVSDYKEIYDNALSRKMAH